MMTMDEGDNQKSQHRVIVSVGSNIQPEYNLNKTKEILLNEVVLLDEATIIRTAPDGYKEQPDFLNGAYFLGTDLSYEEFNRYLKEIENRLGRVKGPIKSGPRCIDLDIIIWDGKVVHGDYLQEKYYVTGPVNEILQKHQIELSTSQ